MNKTEKALTDMPAYDRRALQCLALYWEPIIQQDFLSLLSQLGFGGAYGKKHNQRTISVLKKTYEKAGLIDSSPNKSLNGFQLSTSQLKEKLTREIIDEDWFNDAIFTIERYFGDDTLPGVLSVNEKVKIKVLRDYRLALYKKDSNRAESLGAELEEMGLGHRRDQVTFEVFSNPFQGELLSHFPHLFQIQIAVSCLKGFQSEFLDTSAIHDFVNEQGLSNAPVIKGLLAEELVLRGDFDKAIEVIGETRGLSQINALATIAFIRKDYERALRLFDEGVKEFRQSTGQSKDYGDYWQMFLYGLSLHRLDEKSFHKFTANYEKSIAKQGLNPTVSIALNAVSAHLKNNESSALEYLHELSSDGLIQHLLWIMVASILGDSSDVEFDENVVERVSELGYHWIAHETSALTLERGIADSQEIEGLGYVSEILPQLESWERALNSLKLVAGNAKKTSSGKDAVKEERRLVWLIDFQFHSIQPVEQKATKTGWTKGRNIALKRLFDGEYENASETDIKIIRNALRKNREPFGYGRDQHYFEWQKALPYLVGHPLLYAKKNRNVPIALYKGEPELEIREQDGFLELSFDCEFEDVGVLVEKETELRFKLIEVTEQHMEIANSLKDNSLRVPVEGRDLLLQTIQPLSKTIAIQSDLEEHFEELPAVEPEKRIHALLTQSGEGFHLEFFVKPFGSIPPYFKPGQGRVAVVAELEGVRTRTKRDLAEERKLLDEIEAECPFLAGFESQNYEWFLNDVEECLTAMTEIEKPRIDNKLVVEWTKGQKLKLVGKISSGNFSVSVKSRSDWFEVDGEAKISEDLVVSMQDLRGLLGKSNGNFVELSDGQFVAITESLRKHLEAIDAVLNEDNELHNLRSGILEDFAEELEHFEADRKWEQHLSRLKEVREYRPEIPKTFDADLRPYQKDGFNWLSRLANWGVGACLADDMGLGKTLQTLALLVERAELGPAIVAAPVSVCRNWVEEAKRFAPTLRVQIFGPGDRQKAVEELKPYDVLVTSYSLLQTEVDLITKTRFSTAVLDEAQAIKNRNTKRSRAVMQLNADFRMVTTGTPIENHLGELWNLFNFINPGLLGTPEYFNERFAIPIERNKDANAQKTLQRIVKPFILRRRKNQVLDDLPEKTEIVLNIEMSEAESAFYESIRRDALKRIAESKGTPNENRFKILAELTKLRLASCHPKLVDPEIPIPSSKLDLFGRTVDELLDNNHKALVFSQFVKHLRIVEEYLKDKGITYQYLDGSTPAGKRQEQIDAFQRGEGEIFLISLKAGGTGLNLTAADYVIHLDPWWNPAVEDQATDRVHRIGQQRPVTVYRLVTENSVEEKILKLHKTKRELADSLLDGTESSGKLTADDLLALITDR